MLDKHTISLAWSRGRPYAIRRRKLFMAPPMRSYHNDVIPGLQENNFVSETERDL